MLSTGAFNALLKTLEEPPKHVIFILATTEPQKLPVTILSRCQRFDFRRLSVENIMKRLRYICSQINVEPEENALKLIAKMADGAMRDAISLLDRCVADGEAQITEKAVRELVGVPEFEYLSRMVENIVKHDTSGMLELSQKIIDEGKDLEFYIWELIKFIRDIVVLEATNDKNLYGEEELKKIQEIIKISSQAELLNLIPTLSELQNDMKWAIDKDIMFETGLLKITINKNIDTVTQKNNTIERKTEAVPEKIVPVSEKVIPEVSSSTEDLKTKVLTNLKENRKMIMHTILSTAQFQKVDEDLIHIIFNKNIDDVNKQYMQKEDSKMLIKEVVKNTEGKEMKIKYVF